MNNRHPPSKSLLFKTSCDDGSNVTVKVILPRNEINIISTSPIIACQVWPASIVLTHFLLFHKSYIFGRKIFEFGSGTAIPSLAALKCGHVKGVLLQELNIDTLLEMQKKIFAANDIYMDRSSFIQVPFKWGDSSMPKNFLDQYNKQEISLLLAADCLYDKKDFSDFVATIAFFLEQCLEASLVMCYQDRNLLYSIDEFLEFWNLKSQVIPFESFAFDPVKFLQNNETFIMNDFPIENVKEFLVMIEIRRVQDDFIFTGNNNI